MTKVKQAHVLSLPWSVRVVRPDAQTLPIKTGQAPTVILRKPTRT